MDYGAVLSWLKYGGFIVAAATSIWALSKETTTKDASGIKRLTPAGHVAIAFTVLSAMTGVFAYGLEGALKKQDADRARERALKEEERSQRDAADAVERQRMRDLVEEQRDAQNRLWQEQRLAALEDSERLGRVEQTQRLLLASQPLRSLAFSIRMQGVSKDTSEFLTRAAGSVDSNTDVDSDDDLRDIGPPLRARFRREVTRSYVLYPFLKLIAADSDIYGEDPTATREQHDRAYESTLLLLDLDGSGSIVLPIGGVSSTDFKGYIERVDALAARVQRSPAYYVPGVDGPEFQNLGGCPELEVTASENGQYVEVSGNVPATCMSTVIQRSADALTTAVLPDRLRAVLVTNGREGELPFSPAYVQNLVHDLSLCWKDRVEVDADDRLELVISITPNSQPVIGRTYRLRRARLPDYLTYNVTPQEDELNYGMCVAFGVAR